MKKYSGEQENHYMKIGEKNKMNSLTERNVRIGDALPCLLIGSTLIDLRATARTCMDEYNLPIEFYQQRERNFEGNVRTRNFIGRDFSQPAQTPNEGIDYRIEICQCIPEITYAMHRDDRELGRYVRDLTRHSEENVSSRSTDVGIDVRTVPSIRVYQFQTRPPFDQRFIRETHEQSNMIYFLGHILGYYLRFSDRSIEDPTLPPNIIHGMRLMFVR